MKSQYNTDNIFKQIIDGTAPCIKVFEDDANIAFMDIYPESKGHVLVVSKQPACDYLDFPAEHIASYLTCVQNIAKAVKTALRPDGIKIMQYNGAAASQTVFHVHFHIVPCYDGIPLNEHASVMADIGKLKKIGEMIKGSL